MTSTNWSYTVPLSPRLNPVCPQMFLLKEIRILKDLFRKAIEDINDGSPSLYTDNAAGILSCSGALI